MSSSDLVQPHQLSRQAVIYVRQSTPHQVLTNTESQRMQRAMSEHAQRLGWSADRITVVQTDTGVTATSTAGREAYKNLLSEVALGRIGVVLSYESARLSRNCSDWYPLLDVCALKRCLIADRDGVYEPWTPNGRLLLGMKGILSEFEMHTIRGRLLAGVQNKARRGELALALPAGLVRREDGAVVKDPDLQVQEVVALVFRTFDELRSAGKVVRHFNEHGLHLPRRLRNEETVWRAATVSAVLSVLTNPAYAGAFVYGRRRSAPEAQGNWAVRPRPRRCPMNEWSIVVRDRYPAYISWETFVRIQSVLRDNYLEYERSQTRGVPRDGQALLQGLMWCGECGHKMAVKYKHTVRYLCEYLRHRRRLPVCQVLPAEPIDREVVAAFLQALAPAELDMYEGAVQARQEQWSAIEGAQERELQRLRYEVHLAQRQYQRVDPDNRLVASELERRWEVALGGLREAEEKFQRARAERDKIVPLHLSREMKAAFTSLGESLPRLWEQGSLAAAQKKSLLRCLIDKVVARRTSRDRVAVRIVWRGGAVSQLEVGIPVASLQHLSGMAEMEAEVVKLAAEGKSDQEIAALLTARGFRSPRRQTVLRNTVKEIRLRRGHRQQRKCPAPRQVAGYLTVPAITKAVGASAHWVYDRIRRGTIAAERDPASGIYLVPAPPDTLDQLRRLRSGGADSDQAAESGRVAGGDLTRGPG
ncbi:MAG: recombinase family protein [Myxococcota bacterium]|nr:recombinase family protein [Myxococcota bacterium]